MSLHKELLDLETAVYQVSRGINAAEMTGRTPPTQTALAQSATTCSRLTGICGNIWTAV